MTGTRTTLAEDLSAARAVIPSLADRSSDLFSRLREPRAPSRLPGWTAGDVAVHLGLACTAYAAAATGDFSTLDEVGAANAKDAAAADPAGLAEPLPGGPDFDSWMAALPARAGIRERVADLNALTLNQSGPSTHRATPARIRAGAEAIVAATAGRDPAEPCRVPWFGEDVTIPLGTVAGLFLSETLLHTLDAARASHQKWSVPPGTARLIISLVFPEMMPRTMNLERAAKLHAVVQFHVRGGVTIGLDVDGAKIRTVRDPGSGRADCHISMDPVAFLLAVSGRASQNRQIAAGRMIPYGRKPWLAPQVAQLFVFP
ncbi:hypothetical protein GCM10009839_28810 [Catenulispora yoronensis]|uniref:Mycothiol-dependent maleylpyruvate isomerase metal-binding domain-containing protein n=1 Tax=Catenulispora yoronensis TaxID=450799 RepID=A0ABN2U3T3_9ACTN